MFLINTKDLLQALDITWKSMGYLFLAMFLIFLTVVVLTKLTNKKQK